MEVQGVVERDEAERTQQKKVNQLSAPQGSTNRGADIADTLWSIRKSGRMWQLRFGCESGDYPVHGSKCLEHLAVVLARPNRLFPIRELVGDLEGKLAAENQFRGQEETDSEGFTVIKNELDDVEELLELSPTEELLEKKAALLEQIQRAQKGSKLVGGNPVRKAHHNVCAQIRKFIRQKLMKDMPQLAGHFTASIKLDFPHVAYFPPTGSPLWKI